MRSGSTSGVGASGRGSCFSTSLLTLFVEADGDIGADCVDCSCRVLRVPSSDSEPDGDMSLALIFAIQEAEL